MRIAVLLSATLLAVEWFGHANAEEPLFPFVISYDAPGNATDLSRWLARPAGKQGFVQVRDGHLATDAGPLRFWGTNLCFDACFPSHEQAKRVAARLARLGINCVRLHHMDSHSIWGKSPNKLAIDPAQLERLDFLIYQLKLHGVYVNINLHVSRWFDTAEGFTDREKRPSFDKGLDHFEPRMIELQKKYAQDLLTHVNPYTKTAYVDEPAVAFVEISNEDGLFAEWSGGQLDSLPEPYATCFRKLWNTWLRNKYGSTAKLQKAWGNGQTPTLGKEMLRNGDFSRPLDNIWQVERDETTKAEISIEPGKDGAPKNVLHVFVQDSGRVPWNPQIVQRGLALKKGSSYTLSLRLRADGSRRCAVNCLMDHDPWQPLGLSTSVNAGPVWQEFRFTFLAPADDALARITLTQFEKNATFEFADISLRPGGIVGLAPGDKLEDGSVPIVRGASGPSPSTDDFCDFLRDTENNYWQEMHRFLKSELHVQSLVCGTQLGFSTPHIQAGLDYIDNHAYWEHPAFPHRPWDIKDWFINDIALVNSPGSTLAHLAMGRVAGMAYTVTEYNHPAPNSYAAEGFPMIASFGAFQNWDAIYSFAYSHNTTYEPRRIEGFFDNKSRTDILAHAPACAAMFMRGDVAPSKDPTIIPFSVDDERHNLQKNHNAWSLTAQELLGDLQYPLLHGTALDLRSRTTEAADNRISLGEGRKALAAGVFRSDTNEIRWDITNKDAGYYTVDTPRSKLFTGFVRGRDFTLGNIRLKIAPTRLDWATVSFTAIDGKDFDQPGRILIAATGLVQNKDAKLESLGDHRVTLRDQWGHDPVLCEGIQATITLPAPREKVKCYPLDESGNRRKAIDIERDGDHSQIELHPKYKTIWYEVEIKQAI